MSARRGLLVACALCLGGCETLLGLKDIVPERAPTQLVFESSPPSGLVQQPLGVFTVSVQDIQGKTVPEYRGEIALSLASGPAGAKLVGAATATAIAGVARFDAVGIDQLGSGYTLVASAEGLPPVTSAPIDIVSPPFAQVSTGLFRGNITGIAVAPAPPGGSSSVFAAAENGVYRSDTAGASWRPVNFGASVGARVVADGKHPGVLYLTPTEATGPRPLKKSVDGGATWRDIPLGDGTGAAMVIEGFAIDPQDPSRLYAVNQMTFFQSTDAGETWSTTAGFPVLCNQFAIDPGNTSRMYCAGFSSGVHRSRDGGATWELVAAAVDLRSAFRIFTAPGIVFVNVDNSTYRSTDGGDTWVGLDSGNLVSALASAPSLPARVYLARGSGVQVSNDGGASFGARVESGDLIQALAVDPANPDIAYAAGNFRGVVVSMDAGVTWSVISQGIDAPRIDGLAIAPGTRDTAFLSTDSGVHRTVDGGASWTNVALDHGVIQFDPANDSRAYLCGGQRFGVSNDGGATFTINTIAELGSCRRLVIAGSTFYAAGFGPLFRSTSSGAAWSAVGTLGINDVALADPSGNALVVSTGDSIQRSTDGGDTLMPILGGFSVGVVSDAAAPAHVIAAGCGFYASANGGASFGSQIRGPCVQALIAAGSRFFAAGREDDGSYRLLTSTDDGASWTDVNTGGIPRDLSILALAASADGKTIYVGTEAGLYKTTGR
ncbi:MAG TPA: hypothetical protein VFK02_26740 [Kofleriaceae bacterium]|nr:hypothetical protein [Kofleriaceae bacterium]